MPLIQVVLVLVVVGVILWLINSYIPMQSTIKKILNAVVVIAVILWLFERLRIHWKPLEDSCRKVDCLEIMARQRASGRSRGEAAKVEAPASARSGDVGSVPDHAGSADRFHRSLAHVEWAVPWSLDGLVVQS